MSVITFSRDFPKKHPRRDQSTFFVEQILGSINVDHGQLEYFKLLKELNPNLSKTILDDFWGMLSDNTEGEKHHTIRAGKRWKVGDKFSPRVWSDKPYASKQIQFAAPIEVKKIWGFKACGAWFQVNDKTYHGESESDFELLELIGVNDGLNRHDLLDWFKCYTKKSESVFSGQILCWNEKVNYI